MIVLQASAAPSSQPVTLTPTPTASPFLLPGLDPAAPDIALRNDTDQVVWAAFGIGAACGPGAAGCYALPPHTSTLFTANPAAAVAGVANPGLAATGVHTGATMVTLFAAGLGGVIVATRGTVLVLTVLR